MGSDLYIDFGKVEASITKYNIFIDKLKQNKTNIINHVKALYTDGWSGEAADTFLETFDGVIAALDENIDRVTFLRERLERSLTVFKNLKTEGEKLNNF